MELNSETFERIKGELEDGEYLTFEMIGDLFGQDFWIMLVGALMDAQNAARAIQGAITRLRQEATVTTPPSTTEH